MKNTYRLSILPALLCLLLASCTNFGTKVSIEGTKGEVYYKNGATEAQAKAVGEYLKAASFFTDKKTASVQVSKGGDDYTVRFVYDKEYYEKNPNLEMVFKQFGAEMSKSIFDGKPVNIGLSSNVFKDFVTIPFDAAVAKSLETGETEVFNKSDYDREKVGDVTFFRKGIPDSVSKRIEDYIIKNGAFSGGESEIYITEKEGRYFLRFPVKDEYLQNEEMIKSLEQVTKEIKENVFPSTPYTFQMTDVSMKPAKTFEY